ncbi:MAG: divalent metal cation transporter [Bacteroidota bacterium]
MNAKHFAKTLGPGLLFAATAIGTSHLVLSTRAGAHHGMIFFWIILGALILKYPFYEFGPRYASATGFSLLKGYRAQGKWAVWLFLAVVFVNMFSVVGAIGAVTAGLLATLFEVQAVSVPLLAGIILAVTVGLLLTGGYQGLDALIKVISVVLAVTVLVAFLAVLFKGPVEKAADFQAPALMDGAGLALLIGLLGWMPAGMEASAMSSIWNIEKTKATGYQPSLKESLLDFHIGYVFTILLALMFLTIGAFTVFGSGQLLEGNATQFTGTLLAVFTTNLGEWAWYIMAMAAFGTIYGTLITVMDAFPRCFVRGIRVLRYAEIDDQEPQRQFLDKSWRVTVVLVGLGGFCLFYFSAASMIKLLDVVTILAFITSPVIAWLNLRAIQHPDIPADHRPAPWLIGLAYLGLAFLVGFAGYYLWTMV